MAIADGAYDFLLDGEGYLLARPEQLGRGARAWNIETLAATTAETSAAERGIGGLSPMVESIMVWRSGHRGYGQDRQRDDARYNWAVDMDCRFPEQIIPGPEVLSTAVTGTGAGAVTAFAEINDQLFFIAGRHLWEVDSDFTHTSNKDFGAGKAALDMAVFGNNLYVGMGYSEYLWKMTAAGVWSQSSDAYAGYLSMLKNELWASKSVSTVAKIAANGDPTASDSWTSTYTAGDSGTEITGMASLGANLYIGKWDGVHGLDASGTIPNLTPEMLPYRSADNCVQMVTWHGVLWVPHIRGLFMYQELGDAGFSVTSAGPGQDVSIDNPVHGIITAMAGDDRWLYAALYTLDGDTYVLAGRQTSDVEGGLGPMIWHPLAYIESDKCTCMHISGLWTNPRLFLGMSASVKRIVLPRYGDNPVFDGNCAYATSGNLYYSTHDWQAPATKKAWKEIIVETDNLSLVRYLDVYYRIDEGIWNYAGRVNVAPRHSLQLAGLSALSGPYAPTGLAMKVRLDCALGANSTPLVVRKVLAVGAERPRTAKLISATIRCADSMETKLGGECPRTGSEIAAALEDLCSGENPVLLVDRLGAEQQVILLPESSRVESEQRGNERPEDLMTIRMIPFEGERTPKATTNYGTWGNFSWNDGTIWAGREYGAEPA